MKIIKCDRCGKEFPATHYYSDRQFDIRKNDDRRSISIDGIDLCSFCEGELIQWLANSNGIKRGEQK